MVNKFGYTSPHESWAEKDRRDKKIIELAEEGYNAREIALQLGCSDNTVRRIAKENNRTLSRYSKQRGEAIKKASLVFKNRGTLEQACEESKLPMTTLGRIRDKIDGRVKREVEPSNSVKVQRVIEMIKEPFVRGDFDEVRRQLSELERKLTQPRLVEEIERLRRYMDKEEIEKEESR